MWIGQGEYIRWRIMLDLRFDFVCVFIIAEMDGNDNDFLQILIIMLTNIQEKSFLMGKKTF